MKKILFLITLIPSVLNAAGVMFYDTSTNRCTQYQRTDETPYLNKPGYVVFTDKTTQTMEYIETLIKTVPPQYLKYIGNGQVQEMSAFEKKNVEDQQDYVSRKYQRDGALRNYDNDPVIRALVQIIAEGQNKTVEEINYKVQQILNKKFNIQN